MLENFFYYFQEFDERDWKTNLIELEDLIKKNFKFDSLFC